MSDYLGVAHASVLVADTQRALGFYRDVLGMHVLSERPDLGYPGAWLAVGDQQILLLELPNPRRAGGTSAASAGMRRSGRSGRGPPRTR